MKTKENSGKIFIAGTLAAVGASLCCIMPILGLAAGVGGMASTFFWLDAYRPYLVGFSLLVLALAWYQKLKPRRISLACDCSSEEKKSLTQSKVFLGVVTAVALVLLGFPYYSSALEPTATKSSASTRGQQPQLQEVLLKIQGMTCSGCEGSVNRALSSKVGVVRAAANYEAGVAKVVYDSSLVSPDVLKKVIEKEVGYVVTNLEFTDMQ